MKTPALLLTLAAAGLCRGDTFTVTNANSSGTGSLSAITYAASALPAGSTVLITFDPVFFSVPRTIRLTGNLSGIRHTTTIDGPVLTNGTPAVTISGDANANGVVDVSDRVGFTVQNSPSTAAVTIRHLAFTGCRRGVDVATGNPATVLVEDCDFTGNAASSAGAISCNSTVSNIIRRCRFTGNRCTGPFEYGGALELTGPGSIEQCVFTGNESAYEAGAIFIPSSGVTVSDCLFHGNTASIGGGLFARRGVTVRNCTFKQNSGGAFAASNQQIGDTNLLENCTFTANTAISSGSAVNVSTAALEMRHCTLTGNHTESANSGDPDRTGALRADTDRSITLGNCILAGNTGNAGSIANWDIYIYSGASPVSTGGNFIGILPPGLAATFNQSGDQNGTAAAPRGAMLGPLQANGGLTPTCAPLKNSPAINAGVGSSLTTDQRGLARPAGSTPDSGAVEFKVLTYAQWSGLYHFPSGQAGQNDDPDGDGTGNLVEYFTGTDPLAGSPTVLTTNLAGNQMRLTYPVADHVALNTWRAAFQISQTLSVWSPSVQTPVLLGPDGNTSRYEVFFNAGVPKRFARLMVEQVP